MLFRLQISESDFANTKISANASIYSKIKSEFNVDWSTLPYTELVKPLYSGLAARLRVDAHFGTTQIPGNVTDQGTYWSRYYTINEWAKDPVDYFVEEVAKIRSASTPF